MRVLVTGCAGWIGAAVTRALVARGHTVAGLARPGSDLSRLANVRDEVEILAGDLALPEDYRGALARFRPEGCVHMAWYVVPGRYLHGDENLDCVTQGTHLLRELHAVDCPRTVLAGTCFEYDFSPGILEEEGPLRPASPYAAAKVALHTLAAAYQQRHGREYAWLRIFYQYGPWEHERRLVPYVARTLLAGKPCPLQEGSVRRDFLHVADVAQAFVAALETGIQGPVNVGSGDAVSIAEVAKAVAAEVGREELLRLGEQPTPEGEPPLICAENHRLRSTGWKPSFTLRAGIADTVAWWRERAQA